MKVSSLWTPTMEKIRDVVSDMIGVGYELHGNATLMHEDPLLEGYGEKVRRVLSRKEDPFILKELWRSDELSRSLFSVLWITDPKFNASRQQIAVDSFKIIGEDLLGQRYRGIYHLARREGLLRKDFYSDDKVYLDYGKSEIMLNDKNFISKYPITHLLLCRLSEIMKEIRNKYDVEIGVTTSGLLYREGIKYRDPKEFYAEITYDVSSDEEDRVKGVMMRIPAIKEFWERWVKVREEIAHSLRIPDEAFMIRTCLKNRLTSPFGL